MPKITKLCLNLSKLWLKYSGLFFSRHGVYCYSARGFVDKSDWENFASVVGQSVGYYRNCSFCYCVIVIFRPRTDLPIATYIVVVLLIGATSSKKPESPSFQIGSAFEMKFGGMDWRSPIFRIDVIISKLAAMTSFHTRKCCHLIEKMNRTWPIRR